MSNRRKKSTNNIITSTPLDENLPTTPFQNLTNITQNNDDGPSKTKKAKTSKPSQFKPFATQYFEEIIEKNGLKLVSDKGDNSKHVLTCDPMAFEKNLRNTIGKNVDYPRNAIEFVQGLKNLTKEEEQLKQFLIQNVLLAIEDDEDENLLSDSVIKLLIKVNCLTELVSEYIFERATELAIEDKTSWLQMLLKPFMFLETINSDSKLPDRILDLLEVAGDASRQEIITSLPNIIPNVPHEKIVIKIVEYLNEDKNLTPSILDCLSFLCLPSALKDQVDAKMLNLLRTSTIPNFYPILVKFFFAKNASSNFGDIINGLRDGLDWTVYGTQFTESDIANSQVMTVMTLKNAFVKCKNLATLWIKVINNIKTAEEHKPLDIVILFIAFSSSTTMESVVENVFRKRIKESLFTNEIMDLTFKKFHPVLKEFLDCMLTIARTLLITKIDPLCVELASHWFVTMFKELKGSRKKIVKELLVCDFSDNDETRLAFLNILNKIAEENIELLKPHSLQIFNLKDMLDNLSFDGLHSIMDLIAGLAYRVENSSLEGDVHMLINKLLGSSAVHVKIRGIILGVMAVKHLAFPGKTQQEDVNEESEEILLSGDLKDASNIIELILRRTDNIPNLTCLFYDELSDVLATSNSFNALFINWLSQHFSQQLANLFIIDVDENTPTVISKIPVAVEYCINSAEEAEQEIALNIAGLCLENANEKLCSLRVLPAMLRLTRLIYSRFRDGSLSDIDALLGCGVLMPCVDADSLEDYDVEILPKILNCFVYCINWFRELINAFTIPDESFRFKVLARLNGLIKLEAMFTDYVKYYPLTYNPPMCAYEKPNSRKLPMIVKEKPKKAVKRKKTPSQKSKSIVVEDHDSSALPPTLSTQPETQKTTETQQQSQIKCVVNTNVFRALDLEVAAFFREDLSVDNENDDALKNPNYHFDLQSLIFLLDEINPRLSKILPSKLKKKTFLSKATETVSYHLKPVHVTEEMVKISPRICHYLEKIATYVQTTLDESSEGRDSLGLLTVRCHREQLCLAGLFNMLTTVFSWIGFQSSANMSMMKDGLKVFATRRDPNKKVKNIKDLVTESCLYTMKYKDWAILVNVAVSIVNFYKCLLKIHEDKTTVKHMIHLSLDMMSISWKDSCGIQEKGLAFNQNLDYLLSCYFYKPSVIMIENISSEMVSQIPLLAEKNGVLTTFRSVGKSNFPLLYRSSYGALYEATRSEIDRGLSDRQHIELWKNVAMTMRNFVEILKLQENRTNLLTFLKKSIPILKLFLSQGMPMMELKLKSDPDSVIDVLKTLQHSTRFLHSLHCHTRLKKDTAFMAYLPQTKFVLETLIYKVKIALMNNNCSEAFWMGNLKNKNLHGEVISSSQNSDTTEDIGEEQLPEDDQSIASDDQEMTDPASKTVSAMF